MDKLDDRTRDLLESYTAEQWQTYFQELVLYAKARCRRWQWKTGKENMPKGFAPTSIVHKAFSQLFEGSRRWNRDYYGGDTPVRFLKGAVDSIISNLGRSKAHQTSVSLEDQALVTTGGGEQFEVEVQADENSPSFAPTELSAFHQVYLKQINERVVKAISDRSDLLKYFRLKTDGLDYDEIAEAMNLPKDPDVYRLQRAFVRRTKAIFEEAFGEFNKQTNSHF